MTSQAGGSPPQPRSGGDAVGAWCLAGVVVGVVVALDQATKQLAASSIAPGEVRSVFLGIDLVNVHNDGVAFGFLSNGGALLILLSAAALIGLLTYFAVRARTPWLWLPTGMILGGALGNLADRARGGAVIDFIDPIVWPAFNLADTAIVLGVLGLLYVADARR